MDGGMDGGMGVGVSLFAGGAMVPGPLGSVPLDGVLAEPSPSLRFRLFENARFPESAWDPALRAQIILAEFGGKDWQGVKVPDREDGDPMKLRQWIEVLLEQRQERPGRLPEILVQAENLELYWQNMLMVGSGRPYTATLIEIAMAVGHMVGIYWKAKWMRPRPVQVFPAIMPAIMTPSHPSYPNNHAFQSHLIALSVGEIFEGDTNAAMRAPLLALANRIGRNREVAGVHFPADTRASAVLAPEIFDLLKGCDTFNEVLKKARTEWIEPVPRASTELTGSVPEASTKLTGPVPGGRPNNVELAEGLIDRIGDAVYRRIRAGGRSL
jgi:hypothetical protein